MRYSTDHRRNAGGNAGVLGQGFARVNRGVRSDIANYRPDTRRASIEAATRPDENHPLTVLPDLELGEVLGWCTPFAYEWRNPELPKDSLANTVGGRRMLLLLVELPALEKWAAERAALPRGERGSKLAGETVENLPAWWPKDYVPFVQSDAPEITRTALDAYDDDDPLREVHAAWIRTRERDAERMRLWENARHAAARAPQKTPAETVLARLKKLGLA